LHRAAHVAVQVSAQRGKKYQLYGHFSFVTLVPFVVEKGYPVKNGRTKKEKHPEGLF
jgi:hypothetical protein